VTVGRGRREADAAIAHHHRADAMPDRRRQLAVPGRLAIVMGVDVNEARRDQQAVGIDRALRRPEVAAHGSNSPILHGDVSRHRRRAGAVGHPAALDQKVMHGSVPPSIPVSATLSRG
jgi:hypothetical protein